MEDRNDVTQLLYRIREGDEKASEQLLSVMYRELRRIAAGIMRSERPGHTLEPTAVVHEVYLKMVGGANLDAENRKHFFAIAARSMRQVLVDHARRKLADKRGGEMQYRVELEDDLALTGEQAEEGLALHEALEHLQSVDPRQAQIVEMHYFGGYPVEEIAAALDISERTVKRALQAGRQVIKERLDGGQGTPA